MNGTAHEVMKQSNMSGFLTAYLDFFSFFDTTAYLDCASASKDDIYISVTHTQHRQGLLTLLSSKSTNKCIIDTQTKLGTANSNHLSNNSQHTHTKLVIYQQTMGFTYNKTSY
jgi:hypothetical protein